jgi:hypothetical protein
MTAWVRRSAERDEEGRAAAHLPSAPHAAALAMDDALHRGRPDARGPELGHAKQALRGLERLARVLRVEPGPTVTDEAAGRAVTRRASWR